MRFSHTADFRTGGTSGKWKLLVEELPRVSEGVLPLNVYVCPDCGKIELFAPQAIKDALLNIANKKKQQPSQSSF